MLKVALMDDTRDNDLYELKVQMVRLFHVDMGENWDLGEVVRVLHREHTSEGGGKDLVRVPEWVREKLAGGVCGSCDVVKLGRLARWKLGEADGPVFFRALADYVRLLPWQRRQSHVRPRRIGAMPIVSSVRS